MGSNGVATLYQSCAWNGWLTAVPASVSLSSVHPGGGPPLYGGRAAVPASVSLSSVHPGGPPTLTDGELIWRTPSSRSPATTPAGGATCVPLALVDLARNVGCVGARTESGRDTN